MWAGGEDPCRNSERESAMDDPMASTRAGEAEEVTVRGCKFYVLPAVFTVLGLLQDVVDHLGDMPCQIVEGGHHVVTVRLKDVDPKA